MHGCDVLNKRGFARPYVLSEHTLVLVIIVGWFHAGYFGGEGGGGSCAQNLALAFPLFFRSCSETLDQVLQQH